MVSDDCVSPSVFSLSMQTKMPIFHDAKTGKKALQAAWDMYEPSMTLDKVTLEPNKKVVKLFFYDSEPTLDAVTAFGKQYLKGHFAGSEKLDESAVEKVVQAGKRHRERQEVLENQYSKGMLSITQDLAAMMKQRDPHQRSLAQERCLHEYAAGVNQLFSKKIKVDGRNLQDIVDEKCNEDAEECEQEDEEDNVSTDRSSSKSVHSQS